MEYYSGELPPEYEKKKEVSLVYPTFYFANSR